MSAEYETPPAPTRFDNLGAGEERFCRSFVLTGKLFDAYAKVWPDTDPEELKAQANALMGEDRIAAAIAQIRVDNDNAPVRLLWNKAQRAQEAHQREQRLGLGLVDLSENNAVDRGTEQTRAKRRTDVITKLHNGGYLRDEHVAAANDIHRVAAAVQRGLSSGSRALDGTRVDSSPTYRDPIDRMSEWENTTHRRVYKPWANEVALIWINGERGRMNWLQLTWAAVIENTHPLEMDRKIGVRLFTCRRTLAKSLWRYAQIGGAVPMGEIE